MIRIVFCILLMTRFIEVSGQCSDPQFLVLNDDKLCRNSPVKLQNQTSVAAFFYWDFCPETFEEVPTNATSALAGFANGYGYKLIEESGQWYGFLTSRTLDKLYRLDFGNDPANIPAVVDLGNPGGLMDAPEGIDLYKDGNNWFAFVGKGENGSGQVVKFSFGNDLTRMPSATGYGTFGLGTIRIRDLSIVRQGNDIILLLLIYNSHSINRVNFGSSLDNTPAANNVVAITDAVFPRGLNILTHCNTWRAHVVSENGLVQQISFAGDILGPVTIEGGFSFPSVVLPWKIKSIYNGGNYYAIISNTGRKYSIIDFGDLSLSGNPVEVPNNDDIRFIGIDVSKYKGRSFIQGAGAPGSLFSATYQNACALTPDYSHDKDPVPFTYVNEGSFTIDLKAFTNQTEFAEVSKKIQIKPEDAPLIEINNSNFCRDEEVSFFCSGCDLVSSWSWDFGNGTTSGAASPDVLYSAAGTYQVSLEAVTVNACITESSKEIKIYDPPEAGFSIPSDLICTNNLLTFTNATPDLFDGNLSYQWYVGNDPVSTDRDLQYNFTDTGPEEIKLQTSIPGCSSEVIKLISSIEAGPLVDFSFTGTCEDETFSFQNETPESVETYSWDFADGNSSPNPNPTHTFSEFGNYSVSLMVTNAIGCRNKKTNIISVKSKPIIDFSVPAPPYSCSGSATPFIDQSINPDGGVLTAWLWNFDDPNNPALQDISDPEHIFADAGIYNVSLSATTEFGCSATAQKEITITQSPSTEFTYTPACDDVPVVFAVPAAADIESWYWEMGTAYYVTSTPTHTFRSPGVYPVYLEITGINGCSASTTRIIHVPQPLHPDFSFIKACIDAEAIFTDVTTGTDPIVSREWDFDGLETSSLSPATYTFHEAANKNIQLKVTAASGCRYLVSKQVNILPVPVAGFSASPTSGAQPLEVGFTNTSSQATQYLWRFSDGTESTSTEVSPVYTFHGVGQFEVELIASNTQQCEDTFQAFITTVGALPDVDLEMISVSTNPDGSSKMIITINNKGNTVLKDLPIDIDFSGGVKLREIVAGPIAPASKYNLVLRTGIANPESLRYVCVSADLTDDLSPQGNRICKEFENILFVFPVYPNPVKGSLNLEWISEKDRAVRILISDAMGRNVLKVEFAASQGLNQETIDLSTLQNGIYQVVIDDGFNKSTQRILISGKL